jgi:23S rRNA pseudouridine2605 synthase
LTAEQLEASRSERMRQNGRGQITLEDARTWLEETGLCVFLPRKQFSSFIAPSFVEAVAGERNAAPSAKIVSLAEDLLVRLETEGVAVRLNLLGQPGEQPDFVVAAWVLPYVYALRGDRDWRRTPQLTGSRQVSPLAIQTYKLLEQGDATISQLKHTLGREVTESGVLRAITELWQQLRIIPVFAAPGKPAQWQLLRLRFQKAIAEGASTSQVTAISVLASIYLQAVIAATMEEVELFLAPLTARSKVREVLRGLLATRQVHTIALGHAPHFYVAGTLPEFAAAPTIYASAAMPASTYFLRSYEHNEERAPSPVFSSTPPSTSKPAETRLPDVSSLASKPAEASTQRQHFGQPLRKELARKPSPAHWPQSTAKNGHAKQNGARSVKPSANGSHFRAKGVGHSARSANGSQGSRKAKPSPSRTLRNGRAVSAKSAVKSSSRSASRPRSRRPGASRKDVRSEKRIARAGRKAALTASAKAGARGRYGFTAPSRQRSKKRG